MMSCGPEFDRRALLKAAGAAAVGGALPAAAFAGGGTAEKEARVAVACSSAHQGTDRDISTEKVARLVEAAVKGATGDSQAVDAWKRIVSPRDRVAVKINTLAGPRLSTHQSVVSAVISGLISAGVEPANIVVFDRLERELARAGYAIGTDVSGARHAGTDSREFGYGRDIIMSGAIGSLFSRVVTDFATAIINVPVLKDHDLAGVSLGMKNFYGVIHNPNKYHDDGCDPYIADLSACPLIRGKLRLVVIDALRAQADGGPAYNREGAYEYEGIIAGTDPVAVDRIGCNTIESIRKTLGRGTLEEAGRPAKHIDTAAKKGLGTGDLERIETVRIAL